MKRAGLLQLVRITILGFALIILPASSQVFAQTNDNSNRAGDARRDDDRDRRGDRRGREDDKDFPWGLLGLAGLLGLLGLRKPKRDIYVDPRDMPPPPRDVPPPRH
ncbi:MAG TPA: WGxxGxxG family protein [Blastocatellia bacterium]|nr:WGxxGxxG family protein [Blastocatellia bacterium]